MPKPARKKSKVIPFPKPAAAVKGKTPPRPLRVLPATPARDRLAAL